MKDKLSEIPLLYDFYGQLLTPKQREYLELYYHHDLSLGEIGEEFSISRQAVYDIIRRGEKVLGEYEAKLGLVARFRKEREELVHILEYLEKLKKEERPREHFILSIEKIVKELIEP